MNMWRIKLGKKKTKIGTGNELKPLFVNFFSKKPARFGDAKSETFFANGLRTFQPTKDSEMKINKSKQYKETRISCGK